MEAPESIRLLSMNETESLPQKKEALLSGFAAIRSPQERFAAIVQRGRSRPPLDAAFRTEAFRVEGCVAKLWFVAEQREGGCFFRSDSDSMVIRAVAGLICEFYSGHAPAEILALPPDFLKEIGITQHLSRNRSDALSRIWEKIQAFAQARLARQEKGLQP